MRRSWNSMASRWDPLQILHVEDLFTIGHSGYPIHYFTEEILKGMRPEQKAPIWHVSNCIQRTHLILSVQTLLDLRRIDRPCQKYFPPEISQRQGDKALDANISGSLKQVCSSLSNDKLPNPSPSLKGIKGLFNCVRPFVGVCPSEISADTLPVAVYRLLWLLSLPDEDAAETQLHHSGHTCRWLISVHSCMASTCKSHSNKCNNVLLALALSNAWHPVCSIVLGICNLHEITLGIHNSWAEMTSSFSWHPEFQCRPDIMESWLADLSGSAYWFTAWCPNCNLSRQR